MAGAFGIDNIKEEMKMQKKLYRSTTNRFFTGVCGGIGEYINLDPTIVRILAVLLSLGSLGTAVIIYIVMALIIPEGTNVQ